LIVGHQEKRTRVSISHKKRKDRDGHEGKGRCGVPQNKRKKGPNTRNSKKEPPRFEAIPKKDGDPHLHQTAKGQVAAKKVTQNDQGAGEFGLCGQNRRRKPAILYARKKSSVKEVRGETSRKEDVV